MLTAIAPSLQAIIRGFGRLCKPVFLYEALLCVVANYSVVMAIGPKCEEMLRTVR